MGATIDFLRPNALCHGLAGDDLAVVEKMVGEIRADAGERILAENEASCSLYLLREGQVKISIGYPLKLKRDVPIRTLRPGDVFGELSFLDRLPRSASVEAVTDVRILFFTRKDFDRLSVDRPRLALTLLGNIAVTLSERIRDITTLWRDSI